MASIGNANGNSILKIHDFLGLNENLDGDTTLKAGEMAEMRNFRITADNHLQIRPGCKTVMTLAAENEPEGATLHGVWRGTVAGKAHLLAAYGGHVYDVDVANLTKRDLGTATAADTTFFAFGGKVYLLNGADYKSWDGGAATGFADVDAYIPLVQISTTPAGAGTLLEGVNRLTGKRRVQFSPDGTAVTFQLPEKSIVSVDSVKVNGAAVTTGWTADTEKGAITFSTAPEKGTNTLEAAYTKGSGAAGEVKAMRFSELYNGSTDTRVFLYGDGSNRAIYSGIRYDTGEASADYFPDLYELRVGEKNTPITALVRQYARMMAFKPDSAWAVIYGTTALDDGTTAATFYVQPVNRQFGNEAPGQARLLENSPLTLDAGSVYQWISEGSKYVSSSESNAKRVSDRVAKTLKGFELKEIKTFNLKREHEYWFMGGQKALVLNYANNTWYAYEDLPFEQIVEVEAEKYGFGAKGAVVHFSREYRNDDGEPIDCRAATGAMDFNKDWLLKYSPAIFVAMQPESNARITVTVESDRRSDYPEKVVAYSLATFTHTNFAHFSFATNRKPKVKRVKMKVKKATFYRLIFKSQSASATATVIETDIQMRYAGSVK